VEQETFSKQIKIWTEWEKEIGYDKILKGKKKQEKQF
jgi:hypothetical protein